ncbi:MAG: ABC transporter permease [Bacteroidota bacterium]|nr:ABC transporter permease [Bacteroidota bacterium]
MLKLIGKRFLLALVSIFFIIIVIAGIIYKAPVDPARISFGQRSDAKTVEQLRKKYYLDQPFLEQIYRYLEDLSPLSYHLDSDIRLEDYSIISTYKTEHSKLVLKKPYFRNSYISGTPVLPMVFEAMVPSFYLALVAFIISCILGLSLGLLSAFYYNKFPDQIFLAFSALGFSIPSYISSIFFALVFGYLMSPILGLNVQGSLYELNDYGEVKLHWSNIILPAIALGIRPIAMISQMTRASILDIINREYIRTAVSKGLFPLKIIRDHLFRNALNPILTTVSGWFASLLSGAFFVEYVFNYRGLGDLTITALTQFDVPVILGASIMTVLIFITVNIVTDILYAVIDPRIRLA